MWSIADPGAILSLPPTTQSKLGLETDASLVEMQSKAQKLIRVAKVMSGGEMMNSGKEEEYDDLLQVFRKGISRESGGIEMV